MIELAVPLSPDVSSEVYKSVREKIFYVSEDIQEVRRHAEHLAVKVNKSLSASEESALISTLELVVEQIVGSYRFVEKQVRFQRVRNAPGEECDAYEQLTTRGDVTRLSAGVYSYGGRFLALMQLVDREVQAMASQVQAVTEDYPALTHVGGLKKSGYISSFAHHLILAHHLREDLEGLRAFAQRNTNSAEESSTVAVELLDELSPASHVLAPTVCYNCFHTRTGKTIPAAGQVVTALGKCHRYESHSMTGLERLLTFNMREIIFMGSRDYAMQCRENLMACAEDLVAQFDLSAEMVSASDPFFVDNALNKRTFQEAQKLKYELSLELPCSQSGSVAAASFNLHLTTLGDAYSIRLEPDVPMYSGCVGYGLERFCLAFLSQHGLDETRWPEYVRSRMQAAG